MVTLCSLAEAVGGYPLDAGTRASYTHWSPSGRPWPRFLTGGGEPRGEVPTVQDVWGYRCLQCVGRRGLKRHHQTLPKTGVVMLRVVEDDHWYLYQCQQAIGYRLVAMGRGGRASIDQVKMPERWLRLMPLKRRSGIGRNVALPALDPPALLSKRWPAVSEFLVATLFDDNTCRLPGELKWSAKAAGWQVTLYDVEQALRLSVNAPDVERPCRCSNSF